MNPLPAPPETAQGPAPAWALGLACLGGLGLVVLAVQMASGVFLLAHYQASPQQALLSLARLENQVPWGFWLRGLHRAGGDILLLLVLLHMIRVVWSGAFRPPRQGHWLTGLGLLLASLGAAASGRVLPWQEQGRQLAGWLTSGPPAAGWLTFCFVLHLALAGGIILLVWLHLRMVRRTGGAPPL